MSWCWTAIHQIWSNKQPNIDAAYTSSIWQTHKILTISTFWQDCKCHLHDTFPFVTYTMMSSQSESGLWILTTSMFGCDMAFNHKPCWSSSSSRNHLSQIHKERDRKMWKMTDKSQNIWVTAKQPQRNTTTTKSYQTASKRQKLRQRIRNNNKHRVTTKKAKMSWYIWKIVIDMQNIRGENPPQTEKNYHKHMQSNFEERQNDTKWN